MRKSICFDYKYESTPAERIQLIEEAGFEGVYIHSQYRPREYIERLAKSSLVVESLHLPYKRLVDGKSVDARYVNVLWDSADEARPYVEELIREVEFAKEYGIGIVVMHITGGDSPPSIGEAGLSNIGQVLNVCEKYNITLCLENLRRLDYLEYVFGRLASEKLRFCFDSGHANCMTRNVASFPWDKYGDKLHYLHLNDNDGTADQHKVPFQGSIDWRPLVKVLWHLNPGLPLTLEVRSSKESRRLCTEREYLHECFKSLETLQKLQEA